MIPLTPDDLRTLAFLCKSMPHIMSRLGDVSLRVLLLLEVARDQGHGATEYARRVGCTQATSSRILLELGQRARDGGPGLGLIEATRDTADLRLWNYCLTERGRDVVIEALEWLRSID